MQDTVMSRLALGSFLYVLRSLKNLGLTDDNYRQCGLLQLAYDSREAERCSAVAQRGLPADIVRRVDANEAGRIAGIPLKQDALYFQHAGWVKPGALCTAFSQHQNIRLQLNQQVVRIVKHQDLWQAWDGATLLDEAPVLILATANDSLSFEPTAHLPLQPVRGQITVAPASAYSRQLQTVLCTDGYISPAIDGQHCLGATFSPDDSGLDIRHEDHMSNLAMLKRMSAELQQSLETVQLQGRAALRVATPDYLPLVGAVMDARELSENPPKHYSRSPALPYLEGLYINTGHGSKGISQAPLCAELLAAAICSEPLPLDSKTVAALDPNRFLLRKLGLKNLVRGLTSHADISKTGTS
jgi:tRNA 5-methylaminomethyl-2-thiouridine biosynthesis bifunctional protein